MLFLFFSTCSDASSVDPDNFFKNNPDIPWEIVADEIFYDKQADQYIANGNVLIIKSDMQIKADQIRYDYKSMKAHATGSVIMTSPEGLLKGTSMDIDLKDQVGVVINGEVFLKKNHYYIKGDNIQKTGADTYIVDQGSITTCDDENPAWKITGKNIRITMEGSGTVNNAVFWAKGIPSFYVPYLFFPVKLKRQTGFLPPEAGSSDRKGIEYTQPFFWAVNDNSDFTFYEHHMSKRGDKFGVQHRYVFNELSKSTIMYDFMEDRKVDDIEVNNVESHSNEDWGFDDDGVDILRPNHDRYWFRMKQDLALPFDFSAKLDMDVVSDQDYLNEFKKGITGYNATKNYFLKNFNREIDDYNDSVRVNNLNFSKTWQKYSLNAGTRWYDDVVARRQDLIDRNQQKLPYIMFDSLKQQICTTPFFWGLESDYLYAYSKDSIRGHKGDVHPRLYLPYRFGRFLSFESSLGVRETLWHIDKYEAKTDKSNSTDSRMLYDANLDLSTEIYKIFNVRGDKVDLVKHIIRPKVSYEYIPPKSQRKTPSFVDTVEKKNFITYSLTNTFVSRIKKGDISGADSNDTPPVYDYHQVCRIELEQSYNIDEQKEDDVSKCEDGRHKRPFSPIYARIELNPLKYLSFVAESDWSTYDSTFETNEIEVRLSDNRGDSLFVEYRYNQDFLNTDDTIESIYANVLVNLSEKMAVYVEIENDIKNNEMIESGAGFLYTSQCWGINFGFTNDDAGDIEYAFMIDLYGLGGFGKESIIKSRIENVFERK